MALLILNTSEETANRLHALVAHIGDIDLALTYLLNRDSHEHLTPHLCPTCVNLTAGARHVPIDGQLSLLDAS